MLPRSLVELLLGRQVVHRSILFACAAVEGRLLCLLSLFLRFTAEHIDCMYLFLVVVDLFCFVFDGLALLAIILPELPLHTPCCLLERLWVSKVNFPFLVWHKGLLEDESSYSKLLPLVLNLLQAKRLLRTLGSFCGHVKCKIRHLVRPL